MKAKKKAKSRNPLGRMSPWAWGIEPVRGCNLRCGHCSVRLFSKEGIKFMTEDVWIALWRTIRAVTPSTRVELAGAGEPTLHPTLVGFLSLARKISPKSQIQVTTNGTMLIKKKWTYKQLFDAGTNIIYTDMYAPKEQHVQLARESGELFYEYHNKPKDAPGAWEYTSPELKMIVLMENPKNWPDKRKNLNRLGTFYNNLDWKAAKPFGLTPVTEPIEKGCTQPFRYVPIYVDGSYEFCCQDHMGETAGLLGNVLEGPDGFYRYWFSRLMQEHRRLLRNKERAKSPYCSRCSITFSRSYRMWTDKMLEVWWDGERWLPFNEAVKIEGRILGGVCDGWKPPEKKIELEKAEEPEKVMAAK